MPEQGVTKLLAADIEVKLSWRCASLEDDMKEISLYTSLEFVFSDDKFKEIKICGWSNFGAHSF